jgi:DNA-binding transcriptional regulator YiaG
MNYSKNEQTYDLEIQALADEMARLPRRKTGGLVKTPREIQIRALNLWRRSKLSSDAFRKRIGVSSGTLSHWQIPKSVAAKPSGAAAVLPQVDGSRQKTSIKERKSGKSTGFRELSLRECPLESERARSAGVDSERKLVLELGNGVRIAGLGLNDVRVLLSEATMNGGQRGGQ